MQRRTLGRSSMEVSALGLGCRIGDAAERIKIEGARYPEAIEAMTGR